MIAGPILVHRADILNGLNSLYVARPDWYDALRAVAIQSGVVKEFDEETRYEIQLPQRELRQSNR